MSTSNMNDSVQNKEKTKDSEITSKTMALDFKRRQLLFDSFVKLRNLREYKRKQSFSGKGSAGSLVYTWGAGFYGQLGRVGRGTDRCAKVATVVQFDTPVVQACCGGFHSTVLTDTGEVYTWGDGRSGQLGNLDKQHNMQPIPKIVEQLISMSANIVMIACGQYHTVALSNQDSIFTWGGGKYGQLGHGSRFDERYPKKIELENQLLQSCGVPISVSAGDRHTCIITKRLKVLTFGGGEHGQLGLGNGEDVTSPKILESLHSSRVSQIDCGATNTAAVTETGVVYVWGFGENLHPKKMSNIFYEPREVRFKEKVKKVACGQSHVLLLSDNGDVYSYGNGSEGQIGHGATSNVRSPRLVLRGKNIHEVAAGRYHSTAVSQHGVLYTWGCGESGQLGHNSVENECFPRIVDSLLGNVIGQISCGEHHSMSLSSAEYASVSQDVLYWKMMEDQEIRLKKLMLRKSPAGLKSKEILQVEAAREKILQRHSDKMSQMQTEEAKSIVKRISNIKERDTLVIQSAKKTQDGQHKYDKAYENTKATVSASKLSLKNSASSPILKRRKESTRSLALTPTTTAATSTVASPTAQVTHDAAVKTCTGVGSYDSSAQNAESNLFLKSSGGKIFGDSTSGASAATAAAATTVTVAAGKAGVRRSNKNMTRGKSVPDLHQKRNADGNPLISRIMFFEKASSALRLVKASLEKETPQYMVDNTNVEEIFRNRERLDRIRDEIRQKSAKLQDLKSVYKFMKPAPEDLAMAAKRESHIKELNMKLLTLNTRQIEAEENKRNYELNILRMKDEGLELSKKIEALRGLLAEHERLYQKVSTMSDRVLAEKNSVDSEINKFKADMDGFRNFFAFQLKSYHQILINKISNSREQERKVREKNNRNEERKRDRVEQMKEECDAIIEEGQKYRTQLQGLVKKLEYYEERFHKIKLATGLSDPQDIIDKFYFNEEIDRELKEEIAAHKDVIAKLKVAKTESLMKLEQEKVSVVDSKWKDVDQLQEKYREVTLRMVRRRSEVEQMNRKLAFVQEGLISLITAIDSAGNNGQNVDDGEMSKPSPNDSCLVILEALQHRLGKLTHSLGVVPSAFSKTTQGDDNEDGNDESNGQEASEFSLAPLDSDAKLSKSEDEEIENDESMIEELE